jgi:hypothetical protein
MKKLAVAVFGFMMAGVAVGANWTNDLKNIKGDIFNIDLDSIKTSNYQFNPILGFWIKAKYPKNSKNLTVDGKHYYSSKAYKWIDCKNKIESNPTQAIYYDVSGDIIKSQSNSIQKFEEIVPESISENHFNTVCSLAMWKEYYQIPTDSNGLKDSHQMKSLADRYPYQADMLKGREYEPQ